jgi:hypothetical protein
MLVSSCDKAQYLLPITEEMTIINLICFKLSYITVFIYILFFAVLTKIALNLGTSSGR